MLFPLAKEDKENLKRFNQNKITLFALKKLFLNVCVDDPPSNEAITKITKAFQDLEMIKPDNQTGTGNKNIV